MRLTFELKGPEIGDSDWRANATFEADLFGGFNGAGNFGDEQPVPRLRLAYADLTNGRTTFRLGQAWSLLLGNIPVSTSHIGFPLGWGSGGFIGWRFPGIFFLQSLTPNDAGVRAQLQLGVMRGSWVDEQTADQPSAGEAGTPQFEGRLNLDGRLTSGTWGRSERRVRRSTAGALDVWTRWGCCTRRSRTTRPGCRASRTALASMPMRSP